MLLYQNITPSGIYKTNVARPLVAAYEDSEAEHYALDRSSEEFERRRKKYNVCVIMVILSGRCLGICSLLGENRLLKCSLTTNNLKTSPNGCVFAAADCHLLDPRYVFLLRFILLQDTVSVETQTEDFFVTKPR